MQMLGSRRAISFSLLRARAITSSAAQLKRQERHRLKVTTDFTNPQNLRSLRPVQEQGASSPQARSNTKKIGRLVRDGDFEEAWQLFEGLDQRGVIEYCVGLNLCAKAGWLEKAKALWTEMSLDSKNVVAYTTMIRMYAGIKRVHEAEQLFQEMKLNAVTPNLITYSSMITAYSMVSKPQKAKRLFDSIPEVTFEEAGPSSKESAYAGVMFAYARCGDYAAVRELFMDMTSKGLTPSRSHFNAMITSCSEQCLAETARAVFEMLPHYGIKPECDTWTALLDCHRSDLSQCKRILTDMESSGIAPSGLTYQKLLTAHVLAGDGTGARELLKDMTKFGPWRDSRLVQQLSAEAARLPDVTSCSSESASPH